MSNPQTSDSGQTGSEAKVTRTGEITEFARWQPIPDRWYIQTSEAYPCQAMVYLGFNAHAHFVGRTPEEVQEYARRFIASADLLAACREAMDLIGEYRDGTRNRRVYEQLLCAIALAEERP